MTHKKPNQTPSVLLTGATGFVGKALRNKLHAAGITYSSAVRAPLPSGKSDNLFGQVHNVSEIGSATCWDSALKNTDAIIHLAARAHIMNDTTTDPLQSFREVNTAGTLRLARAAADAGVRRFIFLSSIKVNGESTSDQPFDEAMPAAPQEPYAISKHEAEQGLHKIAEGSSMEVVIIRPPLIYGPGVKANFLRLLGWIDRGIPLPLAGIKNQRSLVAVDNLADFLITCLNHPAAANELFLISDGEDLSTAGLAQCIAKHMGHSARLFSVPQSLMNLGASLLGKKPMVDRLAQSLQVDSSKARQLLQWQPPLCVDEAMAETVHWYLQQKEQAGKPQASPTE
ncbi:MAG: SDR family oxidoreductase [Candidatus Polarisedimenticolaceae bacterium]|nr:SDR family oxidoreductase [Candidatus Polarisedimenticolaceae bacterium]